MTTTKEKKKKKKKLERKNDFAVFDIYIMNM